MNRTAVCNDSSLWPASVGPSALSGRRRPAAPPRTPVRREIVVTNQGVAFLTETPEVDLPRGTPSSSSGTGSPHRAHGDLERDRRRGRGRPMARPDLSAGRGGGQLAGRTRGPAGSARAPRRQPGRGGRPRGPRHDARAVLFREGDELVYGGPGARLVVARRRGPHPAGGRGPPEARERARGGAGADLPLPRRRPRLGRRTTRSISRPTRRAPGSKAGSPSRTARGADLSAARLRLLAGEIRVAQPPPTPMAYKAERMVVAQDMCDRLRAPPPSRASTRSPRPRPDRPGALDVPARASSPVGVEKRYLVRSNAWPGEAGESQRLPRLRPLLRSRRRSLARRVCRPVSSASSPAGERSSPGEDRIGHTPEKTDFEIETSEPPSISPRAPSDIASGRRARRSPRRRYEVVLASREEGEGDRPGARDLPWRLDDPGVSPFRGRSGSPVRSRNSRFRCPRGRGEADLSRAGRGRRG